MRPCVSLSPELRRAFRAGTTWRNGLRRALAISLSVHVLALFALSQRWVKHDLSVQHVVFTGRDRVIEVNATWQISTPSPTPLNTPLDPPVVVLPQEAVIERQHFVISPTEIGRAHV